MLHLRSFIVCNHCVSPWDTFGNQTRLHQRADRMGPTSWWVEVFLWAKFHVHHASISSDVGIILDFLVLPNRRCRIGAFLGDKLMVVFPSRNQGFCIRSNNLKVAVFSPMFYDTLRTQHARSSARTCRCP